jgi:hypothetical protein
MLGHGLHNSFLFTVGSVPEFVREGRFDRFLPAFEPLRDEPRYARILRTYRSVAGLSAAS